MPKDLVFRDQAQDRLAISIEAKAGLCCLFSKKHALAPLLREAHDSKRVGLVIEQSAAGHARDERRQKFWRNSRDDFATVIERGDVPNRKRYSTPPVASGHWRRSERRSSHALAYEERCPSSCRSLTHYVILSLGYKPARPFISPGQ
jgi:hypothetical protein